ncbi:TetR family transcriptional regulator [Dictyobacter sp. S3.2.2.5]|uniref:TetR family transcriptional regulator n=1 Tax=Dictyobacter halimunensis TaxID=3026934 RepID=A0ABQ6FRC6_9CHLR|nr:TetR family transcriptional regulator [Dictyobacter sp. S3.2.2.5]
MKATEEQADLRVRRTHKLLWEALMAELSERPFEEITVKDICERAMVHRTTFYKHYEDKYALLEQGIRQMYETLLGEGHVPPSAFSPDGPPPYFIRLFEHVAQHQQFYRLMLCGEGIGRFQKLVKEYVAEVASARLHELVPAGQRFTYPPAMQVQCFAGAVLSLLAWWLENDMPLTPHTMAHYLLALHGAWSQHM